MGIKHFIVKDSYSRIERVDVMKNTKTVDFYLTVYGSSDKSEIIADGIRFSLFNNPMNRKCSCEGGFIDETSTDADETAPLVQTQCGICNSTGYISKNDYTDNFEDALKQDINILSICYKNLMTRPEFANTEEA